MAALTNVRDTSELGGKYIALPVKGATTIYQGSIVAIDACLLYTSPSPRDA